MDVLRQLFRENEISNLIKENEYIKKHPKENLAKILKILSDQKCNNQMMRGIINANPYILTKDPSSVEELIYKLKEYGIVQTGKMFAEYPFLLNKNAYEIDIFFYKKMKEGKEEEEIRELLEKKPYLIEEE